MTQPSPTLEDIERDTDWHTWRGVGGLLYARRLLTSPPAVERAETETELLEKITQWEIDHP